MRIQARVAFGHCALASATLARRFQRLTTGVLLALSALPGCRSWDGPRPWRVVEVLSPDELRVELPHGVETVHLQFVAAPPRDSPEWDRAISFVTGFTAGGVGLRLQPRFPLLRSHYGRPEALISGAPAAERRAGPTLNAELLRHGLAKPAPDPAGAFYEDAYECGQALVEAIRERRGVHATLDPDAARARSEPLERRPLELSVARAALARARGLLLEREGVELPDYTVVLLGEEEFVRRVSEGAPLDSPRAAGARTLAASAPQGLEILVRDRLPVSMLEDDVLCLVLLHELIHKVQHGLGLVEWSDCLPPSGPDVSRYVTNSRQPVKNETGEWEMRDLEQVSMIDIGAWLPEGHAHFWTGGLAVAAGLGEAWARLRFGGSQGVGLAYVEGAGFWAWVYERLKLAGVRPTLRRGESLLLDRVHATLLGSERPRAPHVLLAPEPWLAQHVEGFPEPPWRLELVGTFQGAERGEYLPDRRYSEWRLTCSRPLFVQLEADDVRCERLVGERWKWLHGSDAPERDPERFLLRPGEERLLVIETEAGEGGRVRLQAELRGLLISFPEPGAAGSPLVFGRLLSPWLELEVPRGR